MPSSTAVLSVWKELPMAAARAQSSCQVSFCFASAATHHRPGEAGHIAHQHFALGSAGRAKGLLIDDAVVAQSPQTVLSGVRARRVAEAVVFVALSGLTVDPVQSWGSEGRPGSRDRTSESGQADVRLV